MSDVSRTVSTDCLARSVAQPSVIHLDADLIVLAKPAGLNSIAARPDESTDAVSWLKAYLLSKSEMAEFGVHSRLDRETSGVIAFSRSAQGRAWLQPAAESRVSKQKSAADMHAPRKTYVAITRARVAVGMMRDHVRRVDGRTEVCGAKTPGAELAEAEVTSCESVPGGYHRIHVVLRTGRTHQIRVQLLQRGAPIVGDPLYGDEAYPRMLLHAERIELSGGKVFAAPCEDCFRGPALSPRQSLALSLEVACTRRAQLFENANQTSAFRVLHESECAQLAIDRYGAVAVVHDYGRGVSPTEIEDIGRQLECQAVWVKARPKTSQRLSAEDKDQLAPMAAAWGDHAMAFWVREGALQFEVRMNDGLSTGIFLDQRASRAWVTAHAAGKRVLNLFSYTCGFSVAALVGGASEVVSVDASKRLLLWGETNLERNRPGHGEVKTEWVAMDVFEFLQLQVKRKRTPFDLVIVDPPTFSTTKGSRFRSGDDWEALLSQVAAVTAPLGVIIATSNDRRMSQAQFRAHAHHAVGDRIQSLLDLPEPVDFPSAPWFAPHLKGLRIQLRPHAKNKKAADIQARRKR